jgi:hypothetical protein
VSSDGSKLYALSPNFSVPSASALGPTSKRAAALISYARPVPYEYYEDKIQFFTILCRRKIFTEQFSCLHAKILALRARQQTTFGAQHRKSWCKHRDGGNSKKRSMDFDTLACVTGKKREILVLSVSTTTHDLQHITSSAQSDFWPCRCYLRFNTPLAGVLTIFGRRRIARGRFILVSWD